MKEKEFYALHSASEKHWRHRGNDVLRFKAVTLLTKKDNTAPYSRV